MNDEDGCFDEPGAATYDESSDEMFAPEVVNPTVDFLAELAVRDAFHGVELLLQAWIDPNIPDCAAMTCLE